MNREWVGARILRSYAWFLSLTLLLSCKKWDLPVQADSLLNGLIAYYPFNGSVFDASGNNLNGQLINGATFGPDRRDVNQAALLLDGVDDYFEIPDNVKLRPDSISISLWLQVSRLVSTSHIYNKSNYQSHENQQYSAFVRPPKTPNPPTPGYEFVIDINNDGLCTIEQPIQNAVVYYDPAYALSRWYHFVSVFVGQTHRLYINGELRKVQKEPSVNPIDRCAGGNLRFGAQADYDPNNFGGQMDEIRIYNRGLTEVEIRRLYNR
ncbi:LamG domain-containing protein [Spirosoma luteum]|uniref:LamG domain-containing protein n=1 Tax=Spirosoma luteum TaxID=431553 RepID=UPI00037B8DB8|nr:LamG domain-containing protein [Spirosoma luteum]